MDHHQHVGVAPVRIEATEHRRAVQIGADQVVPEASGHASGKRREVLIEAVEAADDQWCWCSSGAPFISRNMGRPPDRTNR